MSKLEEAYTAAMGKSLLHWKAKAEQAEFRVAELEAILRELVADDPFRAAIDRWSDLEGYICGHCDTGDDKHTDECPWVRARALLGEPS